MNWSIDPQAGLMTVNVDGKPQQRPYTMQLDIGDRPGMTLPTPQTADHEVVVRTICGDIAIYSGARA